MRVKTYLWMQGRYQRTSKCCQQQNQEIQVV